MEQDFVTEELKNNYQEIKTKIFLHKDIVPDTPICRYLSIEHLLDLLRSSKLYIANRKFFDDKREHGIKENIKEAFALMIVHRSKKKNQQEAERHNKIQHGAFSSCVSCWTKRQDESLMLWKCYAKDGCRISTTIRLLIDSIQPTSHPIFIAPVNYTHNERTDTAQEMIFNKYECYKDEDEIRLCVLSDADNVKLDIDTKILIEKIMITPFFTRQYRLFLEKSFENEYVFLKNKFVTSHLLEYKS